jgi:hypothetical protein
MASTIRGLRGLPSRIALLLGLGAISIASGETAGAGEVHPGHDGIRVPQHSVKTFGDLLIWSDAGQIYVAEAGRPAEELRLGNTAEADLLRQLLEREGATAATPRALRDSVILVGTGGDGFHFNSARLPDNSKKTGAPSTGDANKASPETVNPAGQTGAPQTPDTAVGDKK